MSEESESTLEFIPGVVPANFADLHWSQRRKLVEVNGGTWTNAEEANAFLQGFVVAGQTASNPEEVPAAVKKPKAETTAPAFDKNAGYSHEISPEGQYYIQNGYKYGMNQICMGKA